MFSVRILWVCCVVSLAAQATSVEPIERVDPDVPSEPPLSVTLSTSGLGPGYDRVAGDQKDIFLTGTPRVVRFSASATARDNNLYSLQLIATEQVECEHPGTIPDGLTGPSEIASFRTQASTQTLATEVEFRSGVPSMSFSIDRTVPGAGSQRFGGECASNEIELRRNLTVFARATTDTGASSTTASIMVRYVSAFRILNYNIWHGKRHHSATCQLADGCEDVVVNGVLAESIRRRRPDIVLLQEVDRLTDRSRPDKCNPFDPGEPIDQAAVLASQLGMEYRDEFEVVGPTISAGLATLSAIPLAPGAHHPATTSCTPGAPSYALGVTVDLSGTRVNFYNLHLQNNTAFACTASTIYGSCSSNGKLDNACEQLLRQQQAYELRNEMEAQYSTDGFRYLLGGDLNMSAPLPAFEESYCDSFEDADRMGAFVAGWNSIEQLLYPGVAGIPNCSTPTREWWQTLETRRSWPACDDTTADHWPDSVTVRYIQPQ